MTSEVTNCTVVKWVTACHIMIIATNVSYFTNILHDVHLHFDLPSDIICGPCNS